MILDGNYDICSFNDLNHVENREIGNCDISTFYDINRAENRDIRTFNDINHSTILLSGWCEMEQSNKNGFTIVNHMRYDRSINI